jgi:hypothetical protein
MADDLPTPASRQSQLRDLRGALPFGLRLPKCASAKMSAYSGAITADGMTDPV